MNKKALSIAGLLAIIVLCLGRYVFFSYLSSHADDLQNSCREHISDVAFDALGDSLEYISSKIELFEFTGLDDNLENIPKREIISQLSQLKNSFYYVSSVYLALENGQYYETSGTGASELGVENQEWYHKTKRSLKTNFLSITKSNKSTAGVIATPFYYKGEYVGVIAVEIDNALFKKMSEYFGDDLSQLIIKDKSGKEIFTFDKNFVPTDDYIASNKSYSFMTHNAKEKSSFEVTSYLMKTERKTLFTFLTWFYSAVFIVVIVLTIIKKIRNYKETAVGIFAFQIVIVMTLEIITNVVYYYSLYNEHVNHHATVLEKYVDQIDANAKYLSETVWFKVQEKNIFTDNKLLEINSTQMKDIMKILDTTIGNSKHCINFYYITKDGDYQNYPSNPSYTAKEYNFQVNRTLINGSDRSTFYAKIDMGTWHLKEYVFKVKNDRNNYVGTFGINLYYDLTEEALSRCFENNSIVKRIEYNDGKIYKIDESGDRTDLKLSLSKKQKEKINSSDYGIVYIRDGFTTKPYAFVNNLSGNAKRLIPIELDSGISAEALFIICAIVSILGAIFSFLLSVKEKTESVTFENIEDEYEIILMKNEENYFETLRKDEEIEKGLKVLKIFGKEPTKLFAQKITQYKNRKNRED